MILSVENLSHEYKQGDNKLQILKGLNLKLEDGETLSIMGKSGSGKSTLLNLLAGLMKPTSGEVNILGSSFSKLSDKKRTKLRGRNLGVIFQQFHLLPHLTALENISFAGEINDIEDVLTKAKKLLERVGLSSGGSLSS